MQTRIVRHTGILVDHRLDEPVWSEAGERFARCVVRRRKSPAGSPRRLTDFLIGAHGLVQPDRSMTLDADIYRKDFPELRLWQLRCPSVGGGRSVGHAHPCRGEGVKDGAPMVVIE